MKWKVPYLNLHADVKNLEDKITKEFRRIMSAGDFILRDDVSKFEENIASYLKVKYVIGVNSGTDALYLTTNAIGLKEGDEVITVANTFIATAASIVNRGAKPIFVDVKDDFNIDTDKIESKITSKTKAILPVHLHGRSCKMDRLLELANKYHLKIVEDAAQAIGAEYNGKKVGSFGLAGCFSLHPMKTLNCMGDGGFIATNDKKLAEKIYLLRNHGQKSRGDYICFGYNSRLDNLQAAILNVKIKNLDASIKRRREIAQRYGENLKDIPIILPPAPAKKEYFDTFNSYVIRTSQQKRLCQYLRSNGVETFIHIIKPLYEYNNLNMGRCRLPLSERIAQENVSIPINPAMENGEVDYVSDIIKNFFKK